MTGPWQHAVQPLQGTTLIGKLAFFVSITCPSSAAGAKQRSWPSPETNCLEIGLYQYRETADAFNGNLMCPPIRL
jgi:hypothetical protein